MQHRARCVRRLLVRCSARRRQNKKGRSKVMGIIGLLVVLILIVLLLRLL